MATLETRLLALESMKADTTRPQMSALVEDEISDSDLEAIRKRVSYPVYRIKDDPMATAWIG
jgi:hypothetical protein